MNYIIHPVSGAEVARMLHGSALYLTSVATGLFVVRRLGSRSANSLWIGALLFVLGLLLAHVTWASAAVPSFQDQALRTASPFVSIVGTILLLCSLMNFPPRMQIGASAADQDAWPPPPGSKTVDPNQQGGD